MNAVSSAAARRQQVLLILLPSLVVFAGYLSFFRWRATESRERARNDLAAAIRSAPDPGTLAQTRAKRDELAATVESERRRVEERERETAAAATAAPRPLPRAQVTEILLRHELLVLEESANDEARDGAAGTRVASRRLRVVGPYGAMVGALDDLAKAGAASLVLEVVMTPAREEGGAPTWTLTLG